MKKFYIVLVGLALSLTVEAQQRAQFTQYMVNQFVLNPAVAGTEDFIDVKAGFRKQWLGFPGGPCTYYLSAHMPLGKPMNSRFGKSRFQKQGWHGLGLYVFNDVTGPTSRTAGYLGYAYNLPLSRTVRMSVGAFGGFQQFRVDGNQFILFHEQDNYLNGIRTAMVPDLMLGTWIYSKSMYFGVAMHQMLNNDLEFRDLSTLATGEAAPSKLNHHIFATAGYYIPMYDFGFIPSIMVKYVNPAPISIDLSAKLAYKDGLLWTALAYRSLDALSVIVGTTVLDGRMPISYSYDLTTSELIKHQTGSHEIVIGYRIPPRPRVPCPAHFW